MTARLAQSSIAAVFHVLGGWALLAPASMIAPAGWCAALGRDRERP